MARTVRIKQFSSFSEVYIDSFKIMEIHTPEELAKVRSLLEHLDVVFFIETADPDFDISCF